MTTLVLAGCGDSGGDSTASTASATATGSSSSAATATESASTPSASEPSSDASSTAAVTGGKAVPVYWVRSTARSTFLYREFKRADGEPVQAAVRLMMAGKPTDSDYKTYWRAPSKLSVTRSGQDITVDVSKDALAATGVTPQQAQRSVQQLVWTATAAAQTNGKVTVLIDGKEGSAWGVPVGKPMAREATARAPIWVDSPTQGATVKASGGKVKITGTANVFEGNVMIEVRDSAGREVAKANGTAAMGTYEPFDVSVTLKPGTYTLTAYEPDMSDGESPEGPKMFPVTTTFTVA